MEERNKAITVRLSEAELMELKGAAEQTGMSISEHVRSIVSKGITVVGYDSEMTEAVRVLHEDARQIATELQKVSQGHKQELNSIISIRLCADQLLEINKKLRVIIENLKYVAKKGE